VIVEAEAASVTKDVSALEIRTLFSMLIRFSLRILRIRSPVKIERQGRPDEADWSGYGAAPRKLIQRDRKRDIHERSASRCGSSRIRSRFARDGGSIYQSHAPGAMTSAKLKSGRRHVFIPIRGGNKVSLSLSLSAFQRSDVQSYVTDLRRETFAAAKWPDGTIAPFRFICFHSAG